MNDLQAQANTRRFRRLFLVTAVIAALAVIGFGWAIRQTSIADQNAKQAQTTQATAEAVAQQANAAEENAQLQAKIASVRKLGALAVARQDSQIDLALLLAAEASHQAQSMSEDMQTEANSSLLSSLNPALPLTALLRGSEDEVIAVAFSTDGRYLASGDRRGKVYLWDLQELDSPMFAPQSQATGCGISSIAFSGDQRTFAVGDWCGQVTQFDLTLFPRSYVPLKVANSSVSHIAFYPKSDTILAVASGDNDVYLWDIVNRKQMTTLSGHSRSVQSLAFTADGTRLASGDQAGVIMLWDMANIADGAPPAQLDRTDDQVVGEAAFSLAFSPKNTLAVGTWQRIHIWDIDIDTGKLLNHRVLSGHSSWIHGLAFVDDNRLVSASSDRSIIIWDVPGSSQIRKLVAHHAVINSLAVDLAHHQIASASADHTVGLWNYTDPSVLVQRIDSLDTNGRILGLAQMQDTLLAFGVAKSEYINGQTVFQSLFQRKVDTPLSEDELQARATRVITAGATASAISPNGQWMASGYADARVIIWDAQGRQVGDTLQVMMPSNASDRNVYTLAFSPDSTLLVGASNDGTITIWDVSTTKMIGSIANGDQGHTWRVNGLAFSHDNVFLASSSWDRKVILWDVKTLSQHKVLLDNVGDIVSFAFSPNDAVLVAGGEQAVYFWNIAGDDITPRGPPLYSDSRGTLSLSFSPDGKFLASGDYNGNVQLWDVTNQQLYAQLTDITLGRGGWLRSVLFRDANTLILGYEWSIWQLDLRATQWQSIACRKVRRNLTASEWHQYIGDAERQKTCADFPLTDDP